MAGNSAGARKGWLTRRGQRVPATRRAELEAIERHAAGTFAGPVRGSRQAAPKRQPAPAPAAPAKSSKPVAGKRVKAPQPQRVDLKPVRTLPFHEINIARDPQADELRAVYGDRQLAAALGRHNDKELRIMARQRRAPWRGLSRQQLIASIMGSFIGESEEETHRRVNAKELQQRVRQGL